MAELNPITIAFYIIAGGFFPAFLWLWFWLREDRDQPEPRRMIIISFMAGGLSVFLVFLAQQYYVANFIAPEILNQIIHQPVYSLAFFLIAMPALLVWALIEEVFKFLAIYFTSLKSRFNDEPIDPMIYMIAGALGFVAVENTFFILDAVSAGPIINSLFTGNLRFLGASLVHIISSAIIGAAISLSYCRSPIIRCRNILIGFILATLLHALFNFFIITVSEVDMLKIFLWWWLIALTLLFFFEKVKRIVCAPSFKNKTFV